MQQLLLQQLQVTLRKRGLDVVLLLTLGSYHAQLGHEEKYAPFHISPSRVSTVPSKDLRLVVLVGNTKQLWRHVLENVASEVDATGKIAPDPVDRLVQAGVDSAVQELREMQLPVPQDVFWVSDRCGGKVILAQHMAQASKAISFCPVTKLCIHPTYGPWIAFRCALLFDIEVDHEHSIRDGAVHVSVDCNHDAELHHRLNDQMHSAKECYQSDRPGELPADAWLKWVLPRITLAPHHPWMYSADQIIYHYTKSLRFLERAAIANLEGYALDYLLDAPRQHVMECRQIVQQVLQDLADATPTIDAVLLSGGVDTSILVEASRQSLDWRFSLNKEGKARPILSFKHAFVVQGNDRAQDAAYSRNVFSRLQGVSIGSHHVIQSTVQELLTYAVPVCKAVESFDPMELRNSIVVYAAMKEAAAHGAKTVLTGDGADELFSGYSFFSSMNEEKLRDYRERLLRIMTFSASKLANSFGMTVISPYLDDRVKEFARQLRRKDDLMGYQSPVPVDGHGRDAIHGKLLLRQAFPESYSQWRRKQPIEEGAGTIELRITDFFTDRWSDSEFQEKQAHAWSVHKVFIRDREQLFFFEAFLEAHGEDIQAVRAAQIQEQQQMQEGSAAICPACGFALVHSDQDYCVICGQWPARNTSEHAAAALAQLHRQQRELKRE